MVHLSVPASTIAAANEAVKKVLDIDTGPRAKNAACSSRRGAYEHFTPKKKARIGKRAAEHGITATLRFFSKAFPGRPLKESDTHSAQTIVILWPCKGIYAAVVDNDPTINNEVEHEALCCEYARTAVPTLWVVINGIMVP